MSSPDLLDQAVEAMRLEHEDGPGGDVDGTRWRIRASLERARVARGRLLGALVVAGVLGTGGVSWAYLSGRLEGVWPWLMDVTGGARVSGPPAPEPGRQGGKERGRQGSLEPELPPIAAVAPVAEPSAPAADLARSRSDESSAVQVPARTVRPRPAAPAAPVAAPSPRVAATPAAGDSVQAPALPDAASDLYRAAHQLHFHGGAPAAALAAWDAYLSSQPSGRFALEARYNRAMALIRLRRYHDAQLALQPFARGEIAPAGYRQREAQRLSERLARALASSPP